MREQSGVVTGGAGGIGSAIAARLASEGATVVVSDVNLQAAQDVAKQIEGSESQKDRMRSIDPIFN
ncbi:SDR family NAD(P)-dependent oxidoreductase [Pseudomonas asiatica]|nr:SDR family NAD(P)-dependent oxidoreductase [Pseudomonas asiatica]